MMPVVQMILTQLVAATLQALRNLAVLAVIFTLLATLIAACNKTLPWWRKPDLSTDLCWAIVPQLLYRFAHTLMLVLGIAAFYGISDPVGIDRFFAEGLGPLAHLGFWPQVVLYLLGSDLVMYGTHRMFHSVHLWRFHAVHHSSEHLEWTSAARFHPVDQVLHGVMADVVMLLLGIPPEVLVWLMPFTVGSSALVHANLDWNFGAFRHLLVSPVYHRWHHTSAERGGSSNFAGTFPLFDLIFGTFYMPAAQRPDCYGVDDPHFPTDFIGQIRHPFALAHDARATGRGGAGDALGSGPQPGE
jgi:sterol desaturase/sphingolipid hydroxylase (fatty acid hydroxylase superfamily)